MAGVDQLTRAPQLGPGFHVLLNASGLLHIDMCVSTIQPSVETMMKTKYLVLNIRIMINWFWCNIFSKFPKNRYTHRRNVKIELIVRVLSSRLENVLEHWSFCWGSAYAYPVQNRRPWVLFFVLKIPMPLSFTAYI